MSLAFQGWGIRVHGRNPRWLVENDVETSEPTCSVTTALRLPSTRAIIRVLHFHRHVASS